MIRPLREHRLAALQATQRPDLPGRTQREHAPMNARALPPVLAAQAAVAVAVGGAAAASLLLLAAGEAAGWLPHGARPVQWSVPAWAALFLAGWTLMTGAMMLPSSVPFLHAVRRVGGGNASAVAALAYTGVWFAAGVLQWFALWAAGDVLAGLGPQAAERLAGASLLVAAAFHASPLARACQRACARPFAILARQWRGGSSKLRNAARCGLRYGASCVGCCVPMIAVMFVVGMHHLVWLLVLALWMGLQKRPGWGQRLTWPTVAVLTAGGAMIGGGWWPVPLVTIRELCGA